MTVGFFKIHAYLYDIDNMNLTVCLLEIPNILPFLLTPIGNPTTDEEIRFDMY